MESAWRERQLTTAVVRWLRREARTFERMAKRIESAYIERQIDPLKPAPVNAEEIREAMSRKAMRMADLVRHFSVPDRELRRILSDPENGFEIGAQGWIRPRKAPEPARQQKA